jgi:hypothetical protein
MAEFDAMLRDDTAQNIDKGPWPSALHLLPKKGNHQRLYGDYQALNTCTIPERYPIRHTNKYTYHLSGCTIFSKSDLIRAHHQIPVYPEDIQKAVITTPTPLGIFQFPFMSFGLRNATQTFQSFMGEILKDLDFCFAYEQHPCLHSFPQEHDQHLYTPLPNSKPMAPS